MSLTEASLNVTKTNKKFPNTKYVYLLSERQVDSRLTALIFKQHFCYCRLLICDRMCSELVSNREFSAKMWQEATTVLMQVETFKYTYHTVHLIPAGLICISTKPRQCPWSQLLWKVFPPVALTWPLFLWCVTAAATLRSYCRTLSALFNHWIKSSLITQAPLRLLHFLACYASMSCCCAMFFWVVSQRPILCSATRWR